MKADAACPICEGKGDMKIVDSGGNEQSATCYCVNHMYTEDKAATLLLRLNAFISELSPRESYRLGKEVGQAFDNLARHLTGYNEDSVDDALHRLARKHSPEVADVARTVTAKGIIDGCPVEMTIGAGNVR